MEHPPDANGSNGGGRSLWEKIKTWMGNNPVVCMLGTVGLIYVGCRVFGFDPLNWGANPYASMTYRALLVALERSLDGLCQCASFLYDHEKFLGLNDAELSQLCPFKSAGREFATAAQFNKFIEPIIDQRDSNILELNKLMQVGKISRCTFIMLLNKAMGRHNIQMDVSKIVEDVCGS